MKRKCTICGIMAVVAIVYLEAGVCHKCSEKFHGMPHLQESEFGQTYMSRPILASGLSATASPSTSFTTLEDEIE